MSAADAMAHLPDDTRLSVIVGSGEPRRTSGTRSGTTRTYLVWTVPDGSTDLVAENPIRAAARFARAHGCPEGRAIMVRSVCGSVRTYRVGRDPSSVRRTGPIRRRRIGARRG